MHSDNLGIEKECDWGVPELRPKAVEAAGVEAAPQTQERAPVRIKHVRNAVRFASLKMISSEFLLLLLASLPFCSPVPHTTLEEADELLRQLADAEFVSDAAEVESTTSGDLCIQVKPIWNPWPP